MTNAEKIANLPLEERAYMLNKFCSMHMSCQNCELYPICDGDIRWNAVPGCTVQQIADWLESEAEE